MCGIIGICGRIDTEALKSGLSSLAHRGPDDSGIFIDEPAHIALGHRRLSILDISPLGHQPMVGADGSVVLIFNGEIYNFRELRAELEAKGFSFRGHSDTEVLLNLYLAEGEAMLSRLNGMFALAIWDKRKQSLLIARDALGVKPLYYAALNGCFAFASEIKALLHLVPQARELDVVSLHRYLSFLWCPGEGTPLKAVRKLLPGEAMWVCKGQIAQRWNWFQLPIFHGISPDLDQQTALKGTATHLRQAVHRQMVSDVPLGSFLSGGLDSSAIVAFAREINPNIHCFTIECKGKQESGVVDDLPYARKVAKHLGVPLDVVSISSNKMANDLESMVAQLDEPLADPACLNVLYISQLACQKGIKILLSGAGGDDLFTGYRRHRAVMAEPLWGWLPLGARKKISTLDQRLNLLNPLQRRLGKLLSVAAHQGIERTTEYFRWTQENLLLNLYTAETRKILGSELAVTPMVEFLQQLNHKATSLDHMLALEQRFFLADHNLNYTDKMSMAAGVEVRVPFLDIDLVNFVARIPNGLKQHGRHGKWILKKAMEPYLPHEVIYRTKSGFGAPLRQWMRLSLHDLIGDLLSKKSLKRRGLFEPIAIQRLIDDNNSGKVDANYTLLSLLCIEIWCRTYLDRNKL